MRVEREIAGFAFPFAAGVMAAVLSGGSPCIIKPTYHIIALAGTSLSALLLMHPARSKWSLRVQWGIIMLCALSCGIFIGIAGSEIDVSSIEGNGWVGSFAERFGRKMESAIDSISFQDRNTNAIIKALITGNRSGITQQTAEAFRDSGASHILALSGLHLGIIYAIISKLLSLPGNTISIRRTRSVLIVLACGLYTLATGAGASITRAYIFIILKETAEMTGRHASLKGILATALVIHLASDPTSASDIGFQLSYAAMLGIAFIFPHLRDVWKNRNRILKKIWESAALSISCQITTGPIAYFYFGTFPQYFLLTNLLAIPLAGVIIPAALLTTIMTAAGWCPDGLVKCTEWLTQAMLETLNIIASM